MILAFDERVFDNLALEVSVFGEMAFRGLGIPEKGFREFEFDELTCNRGKVCNPLTSNRSMSVK